MKGKILILDDEERMGNLLARALERNGYHAVSETKPEQALETLKSEHFDVLLTDLRMPGMDGLETFQRAKNIQPDLDVILMTAYASVETVRQAMKLGAVDYLEKPISAEKDLKPLLESLFSSETTNQSRSNRPEPSTSKEFFTANFGDIAEPKNPQMREIYKKAEKIANSNATVLLRGESGTGKEVLASFIQANSLRAGKPFLKVNCGALTETLLESELFGHVQGSFTGAISNRDGLFAAANTGTLMLDEIGEISPALQVKLLRVLQSGEFSPVGDSKVHKVDVRVIAATNRNLEKMMQSGEFREDLYYRLNVVPLTIPPLRERHEDLESLIHYFCAKFSPARPPEISDDAMELLKSYPWPGNIRELQNAMEHAIVLGDGKVIYQNDLPATIQRARDERPSDASPGKIIGERSLEEIEIACLMQAIKKTEGNRTKAAKLLGITRRTLGYRLKKYDLEDKVNASYGKNSAEGDFT